MTVGIGLPGCNDIPRDTYISDGVIKPCAAGSYSNPGYSNCVPCGKCDVGYHRSECGWKDDKLLEGSCEACATCPVGEVRIDCDWRGVRVDGSGRCVSTEFLSPTAWCVDTVQSTSLLLSTETSTKRNTVVSRGLGGFSFEELFGAPQEGADGVDFMCSGMCDGSQKYDSTQCGGPYACGVHTCAMRLGEGTLDEQGRVDVAHSCPVEAVGFSPEAMRSIHEAECQPCKSCGRNNAHGLPDFGRGCALECSRILCEVDEIYDWTEDSVNSIQRCKACEELDNAALCSTADYEALGLRNSDVSGNRARVHFTHCTPKRGKDAVHYGTCNVCGAAAPACRDGEYFERCPDSGSPFRRQCPACATRRGTAPRNFMYVDSSGAAQVAYCQVGACSDEGKTGISQSGAVCDGVCQRAACAPSEETLPCLLPHHERCVSSYPAAGTGARTRRASVPLHANMLEPVSERAHQFSSFENILVDHDEVPQFQHQCVWNAIDVVDNNMNPGGVSQHWFRENEQDAEHRLRDTGSKFCTPIKAPEARGTTEDSGHGLWFKDVDVEYPLLPLQNTVAFASAYPRRLLLNTSASGVAYACTPRDLPGHMERWATVGLPARVPYAGKVYLNVNLERSRSATLGVMVPGDRWLGTGWVPAWRLGLVARETTLLYAETPPPVHVMLRTARRGQIHVDTQVFSYPSAEPISSPSFGYEVNNVYRDPMRFVHSAGNGPVLVGRRPGQELLLDGIRSVIFSVGGPAQPRAQHTVFRGHATAQLAETVLVHMEHDPRFPCDAYYCTESALYCVRADEYAKLTDRVMYARSATSSNAMLSFSLFSHRQDGVQFAVLWHDAATDAQRLEIVPHAFAPEFPLSASDIDAAGAVQVASTAADRLLLLKVIGNEDSLQVFAREQGVWESESHEHFFEDLLGATRMADRARVQSALRVHRDSGHIFGLVPVTPADSLEVCLCMGFVTPSFAPSGHIVHCSNTGPHNVVGYVSTAWSSASVVIVGVQGTVLAVRMGPGSEVTATPVPDSFLQHAHFAQSHMAFVLMPYDVPLDAPVDAAGGCVVGYTSKVVHRMLTQRFGPTALMCALACWGNATCGGYVHGPSSQCQTFTEHFSHTPITGCERTAAFEHGTRKVGLRLAHTETTSLLSRSKHTAAVLEHSCMLPDATCFGYYAVLTQSTDVVSVAEMYSFTSQNNTYADAQSAAMQRDSAGVVVRVSSDFIMQSTYHLQEAEAGWIRFALNHNRLCVVWLPTEASTLACGLSTTRGPGVAVVLWSWNASQFQFTKTPSEATVLATSCHYTLHLGAEIVKYMPITHTPGVGQLHTLAQAGRPTATALPSGTWASVHRYLSGDEFRPNDMLALHMWRSEITVETQRTVGVDAVTLLPVLSLGHLQVGRGYVSCQHTLAPTYCNDGNSGNGDGCDSECRLECGFTCRGAVCTTLCGDGLRSGGEGCDDGNTDNWDGCSRDCVPEPGWNVTVLTCQLSVSTQCVANDCSACPLGHFRANGTELCTPCLSGTYMGAEGNEGNTYACARCRANSQSNVGSHACLCKKGWTASPVGACVPCARHAHSPVGNDACRCNAGYHGQDDSVCRLCPANAYSPGGAAVCVCRAGYTGPDGGVCTQCAADSHSPGGVVACVCDAGFTAGDLGVCVQCAAGTYKNATGDHACSLCAPGKVSAVVGAASDTCEHCQDNTFQASEGASVCSSCHAFSQAVPSRDSCECVAGYSGFGSGPCTPCSENTYKSLDGAGLCQSLPMGSRRLAGSVHLSCNAGFTKFDDISCSPCAGGHYKSIEGSAACTPCPIATFTVGAGATHAGQCLPCSGSNLFVPPGVDETNQCACAPGRRVLTPDLISHSSNVWETENNCALCEAGKFKSDISNTRCTACPPETTVAVDRTGCLCKDVNKRFQGKACVCLGGRSLRGPKCACKPGFVGNEGAPCVQCVAGKYVLGNVCVNCALDHYSTALGAVSSAACRECASDRTAPAGSTHAEACVCRHGVPDAQGVCLCPIGFGFAGSCRACAAGTYKDELSNDECQACPANSNSSAGSAACACVPEWEGDWRACTSMSTYLLGKFECLSCPPNSQNQVAGSYDFYECLCNAGYSGPGGGPCVPVTQSRRRLLAEPAAPCAGPECPCVGSRSDGCVDVLRVLMHVPSESEVHTLALGSVMRGDNFLTEEWQRLHVAVAMQWEAAQTCSYDITLARTDAAGVPMHMPGSTLPRLGCLLEARHETYAVCHLEVPTALTQLLAVVATPRTSACEHPAHFTVVLEPHTALYECAPNEFWDFRRRECISCDAAAAEEACLPGRYVPGCNALALTDADNSTCIPCPVPLGAHMEWVPGAVCVSTCVDGYFRSDEQCLQCTEDVGTCAVGLHTLACTALYDRMCAPCTHKPKGIYTLNEVFVLAPGQECATECRPGHYRLNVTEQLCMPVSTRQDLILMHDASPHLEGTFLRFSSATSTADAFSVVCAAVAGGTVTGHARAFGEGCPFECDMGFHNVSEGCVSCGQKSDQRGVALGPGNYSIVSLQCAVACTAPYFAYNDTCWLCEAEACAPGSFLSDCRRCLPCVLPPNREFTGAGIWRNDSCASQCNHGSWDDFGVCSPHSLPATVAAFCTEGEEYVLNGSHLYDTACMPCQSCEGRRQTRPCSLEHKRLCVPCPAPQLLDVYVGTNCAARCLPGRIADTATATCETCAHVCAPGTHFTEARSNCTDCRPCDAGVLQGGLYKWRLECDYEKVVTVGFNQKILQTVLRAETSCVLGTYLEEGVCLQCMAKEDPTRPPDLENPSAWQWRLGSLDCAWHCAKDAQDKILYPFSDNGQKRQRCVTWQAIQVHYEGEMGVVAGSLKTTFVHITHKKQEISRVEVIVFGVIVFVTLLVLIFK